MAQTCDILLSHTYTTSCSHVRTEEFEEQKEALERDYAERMERLREQLEKEKEKDRVKYQQEIETLRQRNLYTPTSDCMDDSDSDPRRSSTYDLLQSVAFSPIRSVHLDIAERIVEGKEGDRRSHTPNFAHSPPGKTSSYPTSAMSSTPNSSSDDVFKRAPAAGSRADKEAAHISIVSNDGHFFRLDSRGEETDGFCVVSELKGGQEGRSTEERDGDSG